MRVLETAAGGIEMSAEQRLSILSRVADDLAHEIKNPLHAAVINLEVLRRRMARLEGGEEALRVADIIGAELDRVGRRVEMLLRLARPDRGRSSRAEVVLAEVAETLEVVAAHRRIAFAFRGPGAAAEVKETGAELRQRLLSAALQVMERGGVRALALEVQGEGPGAPRVVLTGSDAAGGELGEPVTVDFA